MPFNGSGTFTRVRNWVSDAAAGIKIRADYHDQEDDGFAAGLSNTITRDGQSVVTANIPFNLKRLINVADPVNDQDAITKIWGQTNLISGAHVADTPPAAAQAGNLWWDSNDGNLYLKYSDGTSTQWVQVNIAPPVAVDYQPAVVKLAGGTFAVQAPSVYFTVPTSGFTAFEFIVTNCKVSDPCAVGLRFSWDGGATYPQGAAEYGFLLDNLTPGTGGTANWTSSSNNDAAAWIGYAVASSDVIKFNSRVMWQIPGAGEVLSLRGMGTFDSGSSTPRFERYFVWANSNTGPPTNGYLLASAGVLGAGTKWQLNGIR